MSDSHIFSVPKEFAAFKFDEWHKTYGPLIRIKLGMKQWVLIGDPYVANDILKVKGAVTSGRPFHLYMSKYGALNERGLVFTHPDKRWKRCRAIAQALLTPKAIASKTDMINFEAIQTIELLLADTRKHGYTNVFKLMQLGTLNIIMQTCLGIRAKTLDDPLGKTMIDYIDTSIRFSAPEQDLQTFFPGLSKLIRTFTDNEDEMKNFIFEKRNPYFQRLIKNALSNKPDCFIKEIYKLKEANDLEDDDILVFIVDILEAATDTTAITLSWAFLILSHHKDVQKKLQKEIDGFISDYGRLPVFEEREKFPYLLSVQKECIRYRPAVPLCLPHETTEDVEYQGYIIPKGTAVLANTFTMNFNEEFYDDPKAFIPERYMNDQRPLSVSVNASVKTRDQFVFGWGRRLCPGVHMSDVELFIFWVRILATTQIEAPLGQNGDPVLPDLNAYHDGGLTFAPFQQNLRFIERSNRLI
ncbi:cytochrome P450 [Phascolomyces articulosus]|uniref:Cytochrome P450 n=1 Tax=Phascolomyces articulosus TaxID=60185 RepID=A0AAD5KAF2_9FUNG|nr:cytochrome P450 [Phascolomyces articulosus]